MQNAQNAKLVEKLFNPYYKKRANQMLIYGYSVIFQVAKNQNFP